MQLIPRARRDDRGATVIIVALLASVLVAMAAISVEYGQNVVTNRSLTDSNDSAALGVGQNCAMHSAACTQAAATSAAAWTVHQRRPEATTTMTSLGSTSVTVQSTMTAPATLSRVLGASGMPLSARSTVTWNEVPVKGTIVVPIGLGFCDWQAYQPPAGSANGATMKFTWDQLFSTWSNHTCTGVPGTPTTTVHNARNAGVWLTNSLIPGFNLISCSLDATLWDAYEDILDGLLQFRPCMRDKLLSLSIGQTVLFPIYAEASFWGFPTKLWIVGFAPVKITGFVGPLLQPNPTQCDIGLFSLGGYPIFGNCIGIRGTYVRTTRLFSGWTYGSTSAGHAAVDLGAVRLRLNP